MRKRTYATSHYRRDLRIVSMAGVGGKRRLLSGGTGFLAIFDIVFLALGFIILARLL